MGDYELSTPWAARMYHAFRDYSFSERARMDGPAQIQLGSLALLFGVPTFLAVKSGLELLIELSK